MTIGVRVTNGNDASPVDDDNPIRFESDRGPALVSDLTNRLGDRLLTPHLLVCLQRLVPAGQVGRRDNNPRARVDRPWRGDADAHHARRIVRHDASDQVQHAPAAGLGRITAVAVPLTEFP